MVWRAGVEAVGAVRSPPWRPGNNNNGPLNKPKVDLFAANVVGIGQLFRNEGGGRFTRLAGQQYGPIITDSGLSEDAAWADYDRDGFLDLFTANGYGQALNDCLYRNGGNGSFTRMTAAEVGPLVNDHVESYVCAWADYDNDGWLDLFVPRYSGGNSALFRNQGDGTFQSVDVGNPIRDGDRRTSASWADYDNDGFLDLFIACGDAVSQRNYLYHNNGNSNHWLKVKLTGKVSNASAIGAKVRVKATIRGQTMWQLREINGNSGLSGGTPGFIAHFGLGNATNVMTLQVEWPSGTVQVMTNVLANQILTITEPRRPVLACGCNSDGSFVLSVTTDPEQEWQVEWSADFITWTPVTDLWFKGSTELVEQPPLPDARFYRVTVVSQP